MGLVTGGHDMLTGDTPRTPLPLVDHYESGRGFCDRCDMETTVYDTARGVLCRACLAKDTPLPDAPAPRYVYGVLCSDGVNRAGIGYATEGEARQVMTWGHTCPNNPHRVIRREVETVGGSR